LTPYLPVAAWWTFIALIELVAESAGTVVMRNLRKTNPGAYKVILGLVGFSILLFGVLVWALWRVENFYQVDCHSRQEARDAVRALVLAVAEPQDFNADGVIDTPS
jgi:cytochrome c biogenesis factor